MNLTFIKEKYLIDAFPFRIRVWKNNKVIKTLSSDKDDENSVINAVKKLGVDYDKVTVHDPKTMKQLKRYNNASQKKLDKTKTKLSSPKKSSPQNLNKGKIDVKKIKRVNFKGSFTASFNGKRITGDWGYSYNNPKEIPTITKATELMKKNIYPFVSYNEIYNTWRVGVRASYGLGGSDDYAFFGWEKLPKYKPGDESKIKQEILKSLKFSNIHCTIEMNDRVWGGNVMYGYNPNSPENLGTKKLF